MAEGIVYILEMINVAENYNGSGILAMRAGKFTLEQFQDHATVPQSCKRVMGRLESHLLPCFDQPVFETKDPQSRAQARFQFLGVEGFR